MSKSVFISHSHRDDIAATLVCKALESRDCECWISSRDIAGGRPWAEAITEGLDSCRLVVLVFSKNSHESEDVQRELNLASRRGLPIVSFRIDDIEPRQAFEYYLSGQQWVDGANPPTTTHLDSLVEAVERQLSKPGKSKIDGAIKPSTTRPGKRNPLPLLALAVVAVLAGFWGWQQLLTDEETSKPNQENKPDSVIVASRPETIQVQPVTADTIEAEKVQEDDKPEPPRQGVINFLSTPPGALVSIDGSEMGVTPMHDFSLQPGTYFVAFTLDRHGPKSRQIIVHPGSNTPVEINLVALTATLTVRSTPDSARVMVDGHLFGVTPYLFTDLDGGEHVVTVSHEGYSTRVDTLNLVVGQEDSHHCKLSNLSGQLSVTVKPSGFVYIDGDRRRGDSSSIFVTPLPPGSYEVQARHVAHGSWTRNIEVVHGSDINLVFDFSQEIEVRVTSDPINAHIYVDGKSMGRTTPGIIMLRPGDHRIEVVRTGYFGGDPVPLLLEKKLDSPIHFELRQAP